MPPTPPLPITEDTPPDMLAGSMDLRVVLPTGHSVKMSVERSTPMMDLLVQVTTLNKISTGGHVLQAIGERGILPYKPSTPIGALDTWTIQVVPKSKAQTATVQKKAPLKPLNQQQPFEPTFRLQVHLPRNQLYVTRVSPRTLLSDILRQTCTEKNLDPSKYELRHPANLSQLLSPSCTLADYGLQEVTLVTRSRAPGMGSALSSSDIMALQREEDKRRQQARQQHGTGTGLGLVLNKQSQSSVCEGSVSSDSLGGRSISPARSDESASRSASPPAPSLPPMMAPLPPARPARKRRPAPKPPSSNNGPITNTQQTESNGQADSSPGTVVNGHSVSNNNAKTTHVPVSHSRNSSDSSGYHEASVLSESPAEGNQMTENCAADTLPRQGKLMSGQPIQMKAQGGSHGLSRSMSSLTGVGNMAGCQHSTSNTSLASSTGQGLKKKKAPPPPPGAGGTKDHQQKKHLSLSLSSTDQDISEPHKKTTSLERHLSGKNSAVGSGQSPDKCSTLPGKMKMSERDYRPVESPVKKSKITPETETQLPEEQCLDGDQKIPEVEEDTCVPDISKEISPFHSQTHHDERNIATTNHSSNRDVAEKQDECFEQFPVPPVEITPETFVELVSKSKSPQVVDASTPEEVEPEEYSGMEPGDQVEEAFRSVTAEMETAIKQDEDMNALPPPPTSAASPGDLTVDWEYQLPAPPSAFRDSDSPTLTEGETVMLADSQVFWEPSSSPEPQPGTPLSGSTTMKLQEAFGLHLNSVVHRNEVTRANPLFDPLQCEDDSDDNRKPDGVCEAGMEKFKNDPKHAYHWQTKSRKQDLTKQELMKSKSSRDQSKITSTMKDVPRSGEHVNFTITTYQRPFNTDKLFNEDSDNNRAHSDNLSTDSLKKPITTVFQHHKYSPANSLNSSAASLSRTNSFNSNDSGIFKPPDPVSTSPVKRSTSHISLVTNPLSHPGNGFQFGSTNTSYTGRTKSVSNLAAQTQLDKGDERVYESWSLRKTTSECNVSQDPPERHQEGTKSQTTVEEQMIAQVGQDKARGSQQQIIITEEERARLLALQEQFLQLQEQLLQNSGLMQQQQLSQPQVPTADTPLQSLQVLRSILPQLSKTKVLSDYQATSQQQKSDNSALLRFPTELDPKDTEDFPNNQSVKQTTSATSNQQNINEETCNNNNTGERKRYTYTGPPAINFATWSERPKSQVSIKMDGDYRIGIGQGGRTDEHNKTPARTGMSESKDKISPVKSNNTEASHQSKNDHEEVFAQNKTNSKLNSSQQVTEIEPASLTMRLVSHATASGFRKPVAVASQKAGLSSYTAGEAQQQSYTSEAKEITRSSTAGLRVGGTFQQSDPSRVPIVRAVELKKSFIQQQNLHSNPHSFHSSSTMLNGEEDTGHCGANMIDQRNSTAHHSGGSDADSAPETFAGVNFLAKRFSVAGSSPNGPPSFRSSRPLSSYGKVETVGTKGCDNATSSPYNSTLSYKSVSSTNLNASNVNAQLKNEDRKDSRRYTSVIGINNDLDHNSSFSSSQELASESSRVQSRISGPSVVRVNGFTAPKQLMPVVKGFQFASATTNRDTSTPLPAKNSITTNAHHPRVQRSESTSAIRSWKTVDTTDHPSSTNFGNIKTYMRRNSNEPRPEQMIVKVTTMNAESEPPPPPPLAVSLRKSTTQPRPKTLPAPQLNTRDQLMDAIRNFGGRENLKQVRDNRDSPLNIVLIR